MYKNENEQTTKFKCKRGWSDRSHARNAHFDTYWQRFVIGGRFVFVRLFVEVGLRLSTHFFHAHQTGQAICQRARTPRGRLVGVECLLWGVILVGDVRSVLEWECGDSSLFDGAAALTCVTIVAERPP